MSARRVFVVAAEASGDALGADLVAALKRKDARLQFAGVGGPALAAEGVASAIDITGLGILGFVDALKAYPRVRRLVRETVAAAQAAPPDVAVLIDSWGFTIRVAQGLRAALPGAPLVKYVGPQVWATRPGRARALAATVDHLICIHDFEAPFYAPLGLPVTVAGHPAVGRHRPGDGAGFRARRGLGEAPLLLVAPGSRRSELRRVGPVLIEAAQRLAQARPGVRLGVSLAPGVEAAAEALCDDTVLRVGAEERADAFAAATLVLAASGTVTTEIALQGAPVVVGYRLGWVTWAIARAFLMRARFVTLMNVAAGEEVAPERVQTKFSAASIVAAAAPLLDDPAARARQIAAQNAALDRMGRGGRPAAEIAADAVLAVLDQPRVSSPT